MARFLALALALSSCLAARTSAQDAGRRLGPPADDDARSELHLSTDLHVDRVTVRLGDRVERCTAPCSVALDAGTYAVRYERAGQALEVTLPPASALLLRSRPLNETELGLGIGLASFGAVALVVLAVLNEELCLALDGSCPFDYGHVLLGVGAMSVLIGVALAIDSAGSVSVTPVPRIGTRA